MLTLVSFIFVLGVLIFFHELGHFLVAKKVGIKVDRFSLGFPPNLFRRKYGETTYCIGLIPLGGYVKMAGENPDEEATGAPEEFGSKSVSQRAAVILAGPFMNYLLAILLLTGIYLFVGEAHTDSDRIMVGEVIEDGPAATAGIARNDQIIAVNGQPVSAFESMQKLINPVIEAPVEVVWVHQSDTIRNSIVTMRAMELNEQGGIDTIGQIGIQQLVEFRPIGAGAAISRGFVYAHVIVWETMKFLKRTVFGEVSSRLLGGPVFIAREAGVRARMGLPWLLAFMAILSVNLAVLNVLPIPVLDGGHLIFLGIEAVRGTPLTMKARLVAQQVGLVVLLTLIVFVTYNDILRLLGSL